MKKQYIFIILGILLVGTFFLVQANQTKTWSCDNHQNYRECSNGLGNKTLEVFNGYYNGTGYSNYNLTIFKLAQLDQGLYSYKMNGSTYSAEFSTNPNWGKIAMFSKGNSSIQFLPGDIYYGYSGLSANQEGDYINTIQSGLTGSPNGTEFVYPNAYGNGVDMIYSITNNEMKEKFIIDSNSTIRPPQSWVTQSYSNITFNVNYQLFFSTGVSMFINGTQWDGKSTVSTSGSVIFKNTTGQEVFSMPKPIAYDSNGKEVDLTYTFYKGSSNSIHVIISTPYSFLNSSSTKYPVTIDPSLTVSSGETILGGDLNYDYVYVAPGANLTCNTSTNYLNITATQYINISGNIYCEGGTKGGLGTPHTYSGYNSGAGAGHVSLGGNGSNTAGGPIYGSVTNQIAYLGSSGGVFFTSQNATNGGGAVKLSAPTIKINGTVSVNGVKAGGVSAIGGGSAGTIVLKAINLILNSAKLNATGGHGGDQSTTEVTVGTGGGSGGSIKLFYSGIFQNTGLITSFAGGLGGSGANGAANGDPGGTGSYYAYQTNTLTINSPQNNSYQKTGVTFNSSISGGATVYNVSLYLDSILNETDSSGLNNVNYLFSKNISDGNHTFIIELCDSTGCTNSTQRDFIVDSINPNASITWLNTTAGSQTIEFNTTQSDNLGLGSCYYSILNSTGGIDISKTIVNCSINPKSATASSYGNYTLNFTVEDFSGNINSSTQNFTTSASNGTTIIVGGGGGGTTIVGQGNWTMQTTPNQKSYDKILPAGTSTKLSISFYNTGEKEQNITLTCKDINGSFCQYVNITNPTFNLPLIKDLQTVEYFTITLPEQISPQKAVFDIIGTDSDKNINSISVTIKTGNQGFFLEVFSKLQLNSKALGGFPYFLAFLIAMILLFFLTSKFLPKKTPLKGWWVIILSVGIPMLGVYYF